MTQPLLQAADLRGAAPLTAPAVAALTRLVEALHARSAAAAPAAPADDATPGDEAVGLVWKTVRGVPRLDDTPALALLDWLGQTLGAGGPAALPWAEREAIRAALNGLVGDHLAVLDHPLALPMNFRRDGRALPLERFALRAQGQHATSRVLVLLHDLCMNDLQWSRDGHDHGAALAQQAGYTAVYLHYNSGLSVSTNGRILAQHMERLLDAWPMPMQRLALVGHGMGGLVARSALFHGTLIARGALRWPARVDDLVCLGTPHHGAALDAAGLALLLADVPHGKALAPLAGVPSAGMTDLRHGQVVSGGEGGHGTHRREHVPLPGTARCFALAGTRDGNAGAAPSATDGDGVVATASALGQHREAARRLEFSAARRSVMGATDHLRLLSSPAVLDQVRDWLTPAAAERPALSAAS